MPGFRPPSFLRTALYLVALALAVLVAWLALGEREIEQAQYVPRLHREELDPAAQELLQREARLPPGSVLFLGDSLTRALDVDQVVPGAFNGGLDGYSSWQLLQVLPHMQSLPKARLVVLTIGTNDVKRKLTPFSAGRLHAISKAIPGPMLWNAIPPSIHGDVSVVNEAARAECRARRDCIFLETHFEATDFKDGEHPNAAGNARWIASMRAALARRVQSH
jgi:lysophospholipase L1-like esterase